MGKNTDLPTLRPICTAVRLRAHAWRTLGNGNNPAAVKGATKYIECELHLAEKVPGNVQGPLAAQINSTYWRVQISRPWHRHELGKQYTATLQLCIGGDPRWTSEPALLTKGLARDWETAVLEVGEAANFGAALRELGKQLYGEDVRRHWQMVRPFTYDWPWQNPAEPNARYSEVRLCGDWEFTPELDGSVCSSFCPSPDLAKAITAAHGGNAFILTSEAKGPRVYHRSYMNTPDPIDMDDWRARVIASAGERHE